MTLRKRFLIALRALLCASATLQALALRGEEQTSLPQEPKVAAASSAGEQAIQGFEVPDGLRMELFAAEPLMANPVAFFIDGQGRVYVAESYRQGNSVVDNRDFMHWVDDDLAAQTVKDRLAYFKKHLGSKVQSFTEQDDRIRLLEDRDADGQADHATTFADRFNSILEGTGAGVLAHRGDVYYTNIPSLWKLRDDDGDGRADERESLHYGYGVRVAFRGHDLHGLRIGPDGKLYYSIGDRGYNVTVDGRTHADPATGAIFRCNLDGSELEVIATGLRNPQELAFDEYGNLFTGDNNSDSGDRARWVHVVEGGNSGWQMSYQYLNDRGPWNREKLWHPYHPGQAAYIVPPVDNFSDGPSGLSYYPGTGLNSDYRNTFFLCDFRGGSSNSGVLTLRLTPKGATFEIADKGRFVWSILCTDGDFGPDGAFYISDWVDGWTGVGRGRLYKITSENDADNKAAAEVQKLLADGMEGRSVDQLVSMLEHDDMRVRQEAQFALVDRGANVTEQLTQIATDSEHQLARIHAVWGLGQLARSDPSVLEPLLALTSDTDAEIRAQIAKVVGDTRYAESFDHLIELLKDDSLRVRYFAAQGLGKLGRGEAIEPLLEMIRDNADEDPVLRHGGIMGLAGSASAETLAKFFADESRSARLALVVALRRQASPAIAEFLNDTDPLVVLEAARAIHDLPIKDAIPALADRLSAPVLGDSEVQDAFYRRVLNANLQIGTQERARAVAAFAARDQVPEAMRIEALHVLAEWARPSPRDRVLGSWRPIAEHALEIAPAALQPEIARIVTGPDQVRQAVAEVAARLGMREIVPVLVELIEDPDGPETTRVDALLALAELDHEQLSHVVRTALASTHPRLRGEARRIEAQRHPERAIASLEQALDSDSVVEQQLAIQTLAELNRPEVDKLLTKSLDRLLQGELRPELELELLEAAAQRRSEPVQSRLDKFEAKRDKDDIASLYRESLAGGDAARGEQIFYERTEASCVRCHQIEGRGGQVGPDLSGIALEKSRQYLLDALVAPNKEIARGFESVALLLEDGKQYSGVLKSETEDEMQIVTAEAKVLTIPKDSIEERARTKSPMPEDISKHLTKRDLRDLVEYLATRKAKPKATGH